MSFEGALSRAAHAGDVAMLNTLVKAGADVNAIDAQVRTGRTVLLLGCGVSVGVARDETNFDVRGAVSCAAVATPTLSASTRLGNPDGAGGRQRVGVSCRGSEHTVLPVRRCFMRCCSHPTLSSQRETLTGGVEGCVSRWALETCDVTRESGDYALRRCQGATALHYAAAATRLEAIEVLLALGASLHAPAAARASVAGPALHWAAKGGCVEAVTWLV
jgi:ankyrin repeat protein